MSSEDAGAQPGYRIAIGVCTLIGACVLAVAAVLRESQEFWTNAGGYPLWMRDLVQAGFYPLLLLLIGTLIYHTLVMFSNWKGSAKWWCVQACLVGASWMILTAAVTFALANNILNLMEDRDLHSHPGQSLQPMDLHRPK